MSDVEPVELVGDLTPDEVMDCIRKAVDLAYEMVPADKYENARVNLSAVMVDWLWQRVAVLK